MRVLNRHRRVLPASAGAVGALLETLATRDDGLWPWERWPRMVFKAGVSVGSSGGHGPIRYRVEAHDPGRRVLFRFDAPRGFDGTHGFEISEEGDGVVLTHTIDMRVSGPAYLTWPLVFGPLHDALLEDGLDKAAAGLSGSDWKPREWNPWVRGLRWFLARTGGSRR